MTTKIYAILSDIHANYPALKAVERDATRVARKLKVDGLHFIVLGDVVDYGPQPNECVEWVTQHADIVIQGNHDWDVAQSVYTPPKTIGHTYWPITLWTRMTLKYTYKEHLRSWLPGMYAPNRKLPDDLKSFMLFHSSLTSGHQGYIDNSRTAWENLQLLRDDVTYGLFGHSHVQGYFVDDPLQRRRRDNKTTTMVVVAPETSKLDTLNGLERWIPEVLQPESGTENLGYTPWADLPVHPTLFNPGAVGQSRPHGATKILAAHDNRAAYMLLKANGRFQFQFRRTPYDVDETIRRLREDVTWPPPGCTDRQGSDILKEVEPNPYSPEIWDRLMGDFREMLKQMPITLPRLVEEILVPQLQ